jgi:hypothetical protein
MLASCFCYGKQDSEKPVLCRYSLSYEKNHVTNIAVILKKRYLVQWMAYQGFCLVVTSSLDSTS